MKAEILISPMSTTLLTESIPFEEHPLYEAIISDLLKQSFAICDSFFEDEVVQHLRANLQTLYEADNLKKAAIGNRVNESIQKNIRGDYIRWIDEQHSSPAEILFFEKILDFKSYLNTTCFMGLLHQEFHYAVYPKGTFYKKHIDTFQNDDRRKLSMVCYLNDSSWQVSNGGELVLYPEHQPEVIIHPFPGRVVVFESQYLAHEVKEVKNDKRLSITGWLKTS